MTDKDSLIHSHDIEAVFNNGWEDEPHWKVICACGWEAWDRPTEQKVKQAHALHALTALSEELPGGYR